MTLDDFTNVFAMLAVQLRYTDADEIAIRAYYKAMDDLELEFVAMAAERMAHRGGSQGESPHWFPKTSEWREQAAKVEHERTEAQRALLRKLPEPLCLACRDTGWDFTDDDCVRRCMCLKRRRLEVLGRAPWPELPEVLALPAAGEAALEEIKARLKPIIAEKSMR